MWGTVILVLVGTGKTWDQTRWGSCSAHGEGNLWADTSSKPVRITNLQWPRPTGEWRIQGSVQQCPTIKQKVTSNSPRLFVATPTAVERGAHELLVDQPHQAQVLLRLGGRLKVVARLGDIHEFALSTDAQINIIIVRAGAA